MTMLLGLRFLHYLSMAIWLSAALQVTFQLRALSKDPSGDNPAVKASTGSAGPLGHIGAVGSLATGLGMIFSLGGMAGVPWPVHVSLTLALGMWLLLGLAERGLSSVHAAITAGQSDRETLSGRLRNYRLMTIAFHVLWTLVLLLMVLRNAIG